MMSDLKLQKSWQQCLVIFPRIPPHGCHTAQVSTVQLCVLREKEKGKHRDFIHVTFIIVYCYSILLLMSSSFVTGKQEKHGIYKVQFFLQFQAFPGALRRHPQIIGAFHTRTRGSLGDFQRPSVIWSKVKGTNCMDSD